MQGVGQADAVVVVDVDQALGLQVFQSGEVEVVGVEGQGFGEGEPVEGVALRAGGAVQEAGGAGAHRGCQGHGPAPGPGARGGGGPGGSAYGVHEFPQQPQVTVAQAVQPVGGERFGGVVRVRPEQAHGVLTGQGRQGQPGQQFPGPQA